MCFYISDSLSPLDYLETFRNTVQVAQQEEFLTLPLHLRTMPMNEKPWRIMSDLSLLVFNESNRRQMNEIMNTGDNYRDLFTLLRVSKLFHNM
jgi:hypothetical protein